MNKVRKRDIKLSDYNISREKYNELKYFCLQYSQKKQELHNGYGLRAAVSGGMSSGSSYSNPTEYTAIKNVTLQKDIELIEGTALEADCDIHPWLLKNVTCGMPYEYMDVPLSRTKFYDSRRYFFYLLSQKR